MRILLDRPRSAPAALVAAAVLVVGVAAYAPAARAQWSATQSLYTQDGVEISVDPRVFTLFAMLNGLGYDAEELRGPAPLYRPRYAAARQKVRDSLGRPGPALRDLDAVVGKHPVVAAEYLRAALELGPAPKFEPVKGAGKLAVAISGPMRAWFNEEGGANLLRVAAAEARDEQKALLEPLDKAVHGLAGLVRLGDTQEQLLDDSGPTGRVVVVLNQLDAHGTLFRATKDGVTYVVVGPTRTEQERDAVVAATGVAFARTLLARDVSKAAKAGTLADLFGKLEGDRKAAVGDGAGYATELLACAMMRHQRPGATCTGSPLQGDATATAALAVLDQRVKAFAAETTLLNEAAGKLLEPLPAADAAPLPAPPVDDGKKKGGKAK